MATISSTAFFDALDFGCRAIAISDLGLHPNYGGHVYAGSGVWRSLEAIPNLDALDAELPSPDPRWLEWMGYGTAVQPSALIQALNEQKQNPRRAFTQPEVTRAMPSPASTNCAWEPKPPSRVAIGPSQQLLCKRA